MDNPHSPGPRSIVPRLSDLCLPQGRLTDSPEAGKMLTKQLAFANANKTCKEALRGFLNT